MPSESSAAQIRASWPVLAEWADKHDQWHQVEEVDTPEKAIRFLANAAGAEHREWLRDLAEITVEATSETKVYDIEEFLSKPWPDCEQCGRPAWDHYENENISRFKIAPYGPFGLTADHQPVWSEK